MHGSTCPPVNVVRAQQVGVLLDGPLGLEHGARVGVELELEILFVTRALLGDVGGQVLQVEDLDVVKLEQLLADAVRLVADSGLGVEHLGEDDHLRRVRVRIRDEELWDRVSVRLGLGWELKFELVLEFGI